MGFFDRIINFFRIEPREEPPADAEIQSFRDEIDELREELADLRRELAERDIEEIRDIDEKEVEEKEEIFFRKMVKTGKSKEDTRKIFAYTFEQAYQPTREDELVEEWEIMGYGVQTEYGYTREEWNMMGKDWNFVTEGDDINIRVGAE